MSEQRPSPDDVLAKWDARIAGTGPLPSQTSLIEALREALRQRTYFQTEVLQANQRWFEARDALEFYAEPSNWAIAGYPQDGADFVRHYFCACGYLNNGVSWDEVMENHAAMGVQVFRVKDRSLPSLHHEWLKSEGGKMKMTPDELRELAAECAMEVQTSNEAMMIAAIRPAADRLEKAEAVCEAAASVCSEEQVREQMLCYNMGCELLKRLETWRQAREEK